MIKKLPHFKTIISMLILVVICSGLVLPLVSLNRTKVIRYDLQDPTTETPIQKDQTDIPTESDDETKEFFDFPADLIIRAINPGYKIDDESDVGELIELQNLSDAPLSLAGLSLRYTNGSGKKITLLNFPEGSVLTGEYLLARYKNSPEQSESDITYTTSLALTTGPLELVFDDEVIDTICWTGKTGCSTSFKSANPTTLVRNLFTGGFEHLTEYEHHYDPHQNNLILPETTIPADDEPDNTDSVVPQKPQCFALEFSELFTYYADDKSEQFIELFNPSAQTVDLEGCSLQYKKKLYPLSGKISSQEYFVYYPSERFSLTKNPTSSNQIDLIDADGQVVDELVYTHGQKKSMSYAKFYDASGVESWALTYALTPGKINTFQDQRTCPAGKVINPLTGNCVNITSTKNSTTECPAGKYRNPLTGRCKNITSSTAKECAEGYERNPETNRCRKIKTENQGADFALVPNTNTSKTTFVAFGIVIVLVLLGVLYIVWQFRHEIARASRKARQGLHHFLKHGFSRKGRGDGNEET